MPTEALAAQGARRADETYNDSSFSSDEKVPSPSSSNAFPQIVLRNGTGFAAYVGNANKAFRG